MCGRYAASADVDQLVEEFIVDEVVGEAPGPSWNVAPTDRVPAVVERLSKDAEPGARRKLVFPNWGLVPSWSKERTTGARMINARFETVAEKPSFRKAFTARRCLLPADGYYEWYTQEVASQTGKPVKQPFFIHRADGGPLVMAGLYEFWRDKELPADHPDAWLTTCTVITTTATDKLGHIHDRMPMVIARDSWDAWLDPTLTDPDTVGSLLQVTDADQLEAYAVGKAVGSVRNNGPHLVEPLQEA